MRLHLLDDVNDVIKRATGYGNPPRIMPKSNPDNKTGKEVVFYELAQRFNRSKKVSVILRRIGKGQR